MIMTVLRVLNCVHIGQRRTECPLLASFVRDWGNSTVFQFYRVIEAYREFFNFLNVRESGSSMSSSIGVG